jgi:hypothetical protein
VAAFKSFKGGGQVTTGGYVVCNKWSDILKLFQDCQRVTSLCFRLRGYAGEDGIS